MKSILDVILKWTERRLPEDKQVWVSDLRAEADHVPAGFARLRFQWSGLLAAVGHLLRFRFGPQKMGQLLLSCALIILSLGGIIFAVGIEDDTVRRAFHFVISLYALAGGLAAFDLSWMRRFTASCSLIFGLVWMVSGLGVFPPMQAPAEFLRAFSLEVSFIMAGLLIAASYLSWIEEVDAA